MKRKLNLDTTVNGVDQGSFYDWISETFVVDSGYAWQLLSNIIDYGIGHENVSKDQLANWITDIVPEVSFEEVALFCADEILTNSTLKEIGRKDSKNTI